MRVTSFVMIGLALAGVVVLALKIHAAQGKDIIQDPSTMPATSQPAGPLSFTLTTIDGAPAPLSAYQGKVVLLVNVASRCGRTPQYAPLEALYRKYKDQGLVVIGVPANNFGGQEPGSNEQIKEFCTSKYQVTFPMMAKVSVKGADKDPLYAYLTEPPTAGAFAGEVEWNFAKFLIGRNGQVTARFGSKTSPDDPKVVETIEKALAASPASQPAP